MTQPSPHLTLEQLTARAAGAPLDASDQAHLAGCDTCQSDLRAWNATAGGVRLLTDTAEPPPGLMDKVLESIDTSADAPSPAPAPLRRRLRPGRRRVALASAAAAVVLLGAVGFGRDWILASIQEPGGTSPPAASSTAPVAAGVASTDCDPVKVTAGTLERADGSTLELRTPGGESVTVHASESSDITRLGNDTLEEGDVTDGAEVVVTGQGSDTGETVEAEQVVVVPPVVGGLPRISLPEGLDWLNLNLSQAMAIEGTAIGTVSGATGDGFTVTGMDGNEVEVTTSSSTTVVKPVRVSLDEIREGRVTAAVGTPGADRTLEATTIQQNAQANQGTIVIPGVPDDIPGLPDGIPGLPDDLPTGPGELSDDLFSGLGCDPDTIATTALLAAGG